MSNLVVINARFLTQSITGSQRFAIELCREFKKIYSGEILFVSPDNIMHKEIADEFGVKTMGRLGKGMSWEQIELPLMLWRLGSPILINLCSLAPVFYNNNIVTVLDLSFYLHPEWFSKSFSNLYNIIVPRAAANAKKVVTISENSKKEIISHFRIKNKDISIIYPSVSSIFLNSHHINTPNQYGKYILAVSSIDPRKNFSGLIQAFKAGNFGQVKLVIVGSEHKVFADNSLKELITGDDRIAFTGYVNDEQLVSLYKNAVLFAYPSLYEGFGIPPLEAMACGCPTLVSNTTSLPEVCGDASVYVDPYDVNSIRDGLAKLLNDDGLRASLIQKGYQQIRRFDWHQSAQKLVDIVTQNVLGN